MGKKMEIKKSEDLYYFIRNKIKDETQLYCQYLTSLELLRSVEYNEEEKLNKLAAKIDNDRRISFQNGNLHVLFHSFYLKRDDP